ncbi:hypothetical protein MRX96_055912 [Rhipicephalus microplus]
MRRQQKASSMLLATAGLIAHGIFSAGSWRQPEGDPEKEPGAVVAGLEVQGYPKRMTSWTLLETASLTVILRKSHVAHVRLVHSQEGSQERMRP